MNAALMVTVDDRYVDLLQLFLGSLHRHYPSHPEVLVCTKGWNSGLTERFRRHFPFVTWIDVADLEWIAGPPMKHEQQLDHPVMYARWAALTRRFDRYDTVLYLDADMLVLEPLDALLNSVDLVAFEELYPDKARLVFRDRNAPDLYQLLVADDLQDYDWEIAANAGVIVFTRSQRTAGHLAEAQRITRRYAAHLMWGDQSMFNIWMARHRLRVTHDCRYNYQLRLLLEEKRPCCPFRDVKILHFNGQRADRLTLMAAAFLITTAIPFGRITVPVMLRLLASPVLNWLPGYRLREALGRALIERALKAAVIQTT